MSIDLRSSGQVCKRAGITRATLTHWIEKGWIKPAITLPSTAGRFFTEAEVERAVQLYEARKAVKAARQTGDAA